MNRKWLAFVVLVGMLLAAIAPGGAAAGWWSPLSCGLGFDSAHDSTECWWWRGLYSIPAAGGNATLLVGAYAEHWQIGQSGQVPSSEGAAREWIPETKISFDDVTLSPTAQVTIKLYDSLDPSRMLFSFQGTLAELMALVRAETAFSGAYGVLIRIPLLVPAGQTLWIGRMDLVQGGYRAHCDLYLVQGLPLIIRIV